MDASGGTPISYLALAPGTPVLGADGEQVATVLEVLEDSSLDLFDGIVVTTELGARFVDADAVVEITDRYVRTTATSVAELPEPKEQVVLQPASRRRWRRRRAH